MKIRIFYDNVRYRLREAGKTIEIIKKVIREEKKVPGDLNYIFTDDKSLIKINKEFLNHNYYTDVIAFENNNLKTVNGEIYISVDTVKRNAVNYKVSLKEEIRRVIIHGTLHLCGYIDDTKEKKELMRNKEDYWLEKIKEEF